MVDFQQRDTRRAVDEDAEEEADEEAAAAGPSDEGTDAPEEHSDHDEHEDHDEHHAHDRETLGAAVVTISSTRTRESDPSGDAVQELLEAESHDVVVREIIRDDHDGVQNAVDALVSRSDVDVVVTTGGTGVTPDDVTIEAVRPLFDKELPGFGELFRRRSEPEIGTRVIGTRATAGVTDSAVVFCLPGSEDAARLGAGEIVVAEAPHLVGLVDRE